MILPSPPPILSRRAIPSSLRLANARQSLAGSVFPGRAWEQGQEVCSQAEPGNKGKWMLLSQCHASSAPSTRAPD